MIVFAGSMILCGRRMIVCGAKPIAEAAAIRVSLAEKIESWTDLMAGGIEVLVSHSSTISDDAEIIVKETELIVPVGHAACEHVLETGYCDGEVCEFDQKSPVKLADLSDCCRFKTIAKNHRFFVLYPR